MRQGRLLSVAASSRLARQFELGFQKGLSPTVFETKSTAVWQLEETAEWRQSHRIAIAARNARLFKGDTHKMILVSTLAAVSAGFELRPPPSFRTTLAERRLFAFQVSTIRNAVHLPRVTRAQMSSW